MEKWEYTTFIEYTEGIPSRIIDLDSVNKQMNDLASQGWEFVETQRIDANGWTQKILFIFRRKIN